MWTYTGTMAFTAPEVFLDVEYTENVDMWSAGVVLYTMLCGYQPFHSENTQDLIDLIKEGKYTFHPDPWDNILDEAKGLIKHCLEVDNKKRYSPTDALMHPWVTHHGKVPNTKLLFKDSFRAYYKKRDHENGKIASDQMQKIQVLSPNLAVAGPATRTKRRCDTMVINLQKPIDKPTAIYSRSSKETSSKDTRMRDILPQIQEISNDESPVQKLSDLRGNNSKAFYERVRDLTNLMVTEDLGSNSSPNEKSMSSEYNTVI